MRIVSGSHRGRSFHPPKNIKARPTTDMAKEGLFNVLNNHFYFEELSVLDLFAGTGSISYEFASRGCPSIIAVEKKAQHSAFIRKTATELDFNQLKVVQQDVFRYLKFPAARFELIFADPPYDLEKIEILPDLIFKNQLLKDEGWFILEHSAKNSFTTHPNYINHRKYGHVNFSFFATQKEA